MRLIEEAELHPVLDEMARAIAALPGFDTRSTAMVGIHTGGLWVAQALNRRLALAAPVGSLNISFYRDDFRRIGLHPQVKPSHLPADVENRHVLLVDDVLYTGRTVRAALNEIFDYGRPSAVALAVLVERNGRELPICADVAGMRLELAAGGHAQLTGPEPLQLRFTP